MTDQAINFFLASGTTAERTAFTPNPATTAVGPDQGYFWFDTDLNAVYGWDGAAWSAPSGTGTVTSVATGTGLTGGPITSTGTVSLANIADHKILANISGGSAAPVENTVTAVIDNAIGSTQGDLLYRNSTVWTILAPGTAGQSLITAGAAANPAWADRAITPPQGRLTLTTLTPVLTADTLSATTVYYTPYIGGIVPIYNGTYFVPTAFSEVSQATTDSTKSPAACTTNSNYDIFVWNDSGTIRATRGPLWTSDTARGTGAGTTELQMVTGIWTNKVAITNGPGAGLGTYVGSIRTDGSSQVNMKMIPTGASGGCNNVLGVYNAYNRVNTSALNRDSKATWTYNSTTWQPADGGSSNTAMRVNFIDGLAQSPIRGLWQVFQTMASSSSWAGMNLDSTTNVPQVSLQNFSTGSITTVEDIWLPVLGFHYIQAMEASSGTTTYFGDRTVPTAHMNGLVVELEM